MSLLAVLDGSEQFLTLTQKQMLDALLGEDAVSDEAVRDWAAAVDIDAFDAASYRLVGVKRTWLPQREMSAFNPKRNAD